MSACVSALSNCIVVFANIDHITFDTACRFFQVALRDGGGPPVSIFLGSGGTYVRHSRDMSDLTKICSKTTFMKKSYHKEVIENTFHVLKCSKSLLRCIQPL